jgi:RNA polymerase sigma-70 factor (ECF subfamily)
MRLDDLAGSPGAPALDSLARAAQRALALGDRPAAAAAFEPIVARCQRRASRLAYWYTRHADEADEVVQESFLKVFERLEQYRPDLPFEAWLTRVLVNGCLDRTKARARRSRWQSPVDEVATLAQRVASREPSPERRVLDHERKTRLAEAIDQLPARQKTVVLLTQLGEHSSAEVGEMTGLSESTVRVHLHRAMRRLRELLGAPETPARAAGGHTT